MLVSTLGTIGEDDAVRDEAARRFDVAVGGGPRLDRDLEGAILAVVADQRRTGDYDAFYARYRVGHDAPGGAALPGRAGRRSPTSSSAHARFELALARSADPGRAPPSSSGCSPTGSAGRPASSS